MPKSAKADLGGSLAPLGPRNDSAFGDESLAKEPPLPLQPPRTKDDAVFLPRPCVDEGDMTSTRRDTRAITRRGIPSGAALILGGLLLLIVP